MTYLEVRMCLGKCDQWEKNFLKFLPKVFEKEVSWSSSFFVAFPWSYNPLGRSVISIRKEKRPPLGKRYTFTKWIMAVNFCLSKRSFGMAVNEQLFEMRFSVTHHFLGFPSPPWGYSGLPPIEDSARKKWKSWPSIPSEYLFSR